MYAAIRQYEVGSGAASEVIPIVSEGLADTLSRRPGFVAYHLIASGSDEIVSVTIFEDEQSALGSNELAAQFVRDSLARFELSLTSSMGGEVGVSRVAPEVLGAKRS